MDTSSHPPTYQAQVARNVSEAIEAAGLTQLAVSEATLIPRTTLLRHLSGAGRGFSANELKAIADLLDVPIESLIAVSEDVA